MAPSLTAKTARRSAATYYAAHRRKRQGPPDRGSKSGTGGWKRYQ